MIVLRWEHRRICAGLIAFTLSAVVLTGCGANGSGGKREIPAPGESSETRQNVSQTPESNKTSELQSTAIQNKGTIASLCEIKQKAVSSGYETSNLIEIQKKMAEGIADGFNIVIGDSQNPVLEFETAEKAQAYAEYVNAAGTGAVIVNGRFFIYLQAKTDSSIDEEILQALEGFMDTSALTRPDASEQDYFFASESTSDYKSAYALMAQINTAMSTLLNKTLESYNKEHPEGDPKNAAEVMPLLFNSIDLCFTAYFCEDEAAYAGIVAAAEMVGITETKMTRNGAHDYTLLGKTFGGKAFEIQGVYDPSTGGLRMVNNTEGTITEYFEFIPLGDGQYAFQNDTERALAVYRDGNLESFVYTRTGSNAGYDNETDSIFPAGAPVDENWAVGRGKNDYAEYYAFDGQTVKLNVKTFGDRVIDEISASAKAS
ncbi:MAG: hypothetical protein EOM54_14140 [Clostridia bacterium]|nr:hypothetical protein [Clostridia bacterium]